MSEEFEIKPYKGTLYHGSPKPIKSFDPTKGGGRFGPGLYLAGKEWAEFYAKGGRQGQAGQKLKDIPGHLYEFEINTNNALYVYDEYEFAQEVISYNEEAEEVFRDWGDPLKATPFFSEFAQDHLGADVLVFQEKDGGVLSPIDQVVVFTKSAIRSSKPYEAEASLKVTAGKVTLYHGTNTNRLDSALANKFYHGSPYKFKKFKLDNKGVNYGPGIYFTEDREEAIEYATNHDEPGYLYEARISSNKQFDTSSAKDAKKVSDELDLIWAEVEADELWKDTSSGLSAEDKGNFYHKLASVLGDKLKSEGTEWYKAKGLINKTIEDLGWDAIHDPVAGWVIVTNPNKVKVDKVTKVPYVEKSHEEWQAAEDEKTKRRKARIGSSIVVANSFNTTFKKTFEENSFRYDWEEYVLNPQEGEWDEGLAPQEIADYVKYEGEIDTDHEDWEATAKKYLKKRYGEFEKKFAKAKVTKGYLEIYRCISVAHPHEILDQIEGGNSLGSYWAFTLKGAGCYWGNQDHNVVVTALVKPTQIDVKRTLIVNLEPGGSEDEIFIHEGTSILVVEAKEGKEVIWQGKQVAQAYKAKVYNQSWNHLLDSWGNGHGNR